MSVSEIHILKYGSKADQETSYDSFKIIHSRLVNLGTENFIFQAEVLAIEEAIRWLDASNYKRFKIHSDSYLNLQHLENILTSIFLIQSMIKALQHSFKTF